MSEWFPQSQPQSKPQEEAYPDQPRQPAQPYNHPYGYQPPVPPDQPTAAPPPILTPDPAPRPPAPDPFAGAPPAAPPATPYGDQQLPPAAPPPAAPVPLGPGGQPEWWTPAEPEAQPAGRSRSAATPSAPGAGLARGLAALAWPALLIGLVVRPGGQDTYLKQVPAWSLFAVACLVLVAIGAFGRAAGPGPSRNWTLGALGAGGLVGFWVLLVLPVIATNTAFALTVATGCGCAAVWLSPGRRW